MLERLNIKLAIARQCELNLLGQLRRRTRLLLRVGDKAGFQ